MNGPGPSGDDGVCNGPPAPRVVLYDPERIRLEWRQVERVGVGLLNQGNTCFMNAALQCLTYTPPLVNYCFSDEHPKSCTPGKLFCLMCKFREHIKTTFDRKNGCAIKPVWMFDKAKNNIIPKKYTGHKQEDAHEFLRVLVDGLQRACLNGHTGLDKLSKETTVVNQIFGGYLQSQVECMRCKGCSNTYDPFLDISLDIKDVHRLEDAFAKYVKPETLDLDNAYRCERCHQHVKAQKRLSIYKEPNVLTIQLKRFDFMMISAAKISRHVHFPDRFDLRSHMSRQGEPVYYRLYGVLIHSGLNLHHGHYYSYVKSPSNSWYLMNDGVVQSAHPREVFQSEAYVLFYVRDKATRHHLPAKAPFIGPTLNGVMNTKFNGTAGKHTVGNSYPKPPKARVEIGAPVPQPTMVSVKTPHIPVAPNRASMATALPQKHKKISFGLSPKPFQPVQNQMAQSIQRQNPTDSSSSPPKRIIMVIKNGKVTNLDKPLDGKPAVVKSSPHLVPYEDDSDSGGEGSSKHSEGDSGKRSPSVDGNCADQEKENCASKKCSAFHQGAFSVFSSSTSTAKSPLRETSDSGGLDRSWPVKSEGVNSTAPSVTSYKPKTDSVEDMKESNDVQPTTSVASTPTCPVQNGPSNLYNNGNHTVSKPSVGESQVKLNGFAARPHDTSLHSVKFRTSPVRSRGLLTRSGSLDDGLVHVRKFKRSSSLEPKLRHVDPVLVNQNGHSGDVGSGVKTDTVGATAEIPNWCDDSSSSHQNSVGVKENSRLDFVPNGESVHIPNGEPVHVNGYQSSKTHLFVGRTDSPHESRKKHKKKKHKRDKDRYSEARDGVSSEDGHRRKHKKRRHRHEYDEHDHDSKSRRHREHETDHEHRSKRHNGYHSVEYESQSARKRRKSDSSESEYTWEERTKETLLKEQAENGLSGRLWGTERNSTDAEMERDQRGAHHRLYTDGYDEDTDKMAKFKRRLDEPSQSNSYFHKYPNHKGLDRDGRKWREDYSSHHQFQSYSNGPVPSYSHSHGDQGYYRYNNTNHRYRDHYNRNTSNGSHHYSFARSYTYPKHQRRY